MSLLSESDRAAPDQACPLQEGEKGKHRCRIPVLIALFFCNWGLFSPTEISFCAGEWWKRLSIVCKIQGGKAEMDESYWKQGLHQSTLGCNARSLHVEILLVSFWLSTTVTVDNSRKKQPQKLKIICMFFFMPPEWMWNIPVNWNHNSLEGHVTFEATWGSSTSLLYQRETCRLACSCLLIRSHIFRKDASIDFGLPGVDN